LLHPLEHPRPRATQIGILTAKAGAAKRGRYRSTDFADSRRFQCRGFKSAKICAICGSSTLLFLLCVLRVSAVSLTLPRSGRPDFDDPGLMAGFHGGEDHADGEEGYLVVDTDRVLLRSSEPTSWALASR